MVAEFSSLVNPGTPVPQAITELTGISDQMLAAAPPVAAVLPGLLAFAEGSVIAAHNAPFDLGFLTAACAGMGRDWPGFEVLDTVRLARHLMATPQEVPDRKLATLASFFGTPVRPSHRALDDARATAAVLGRLLARLADREGIMHARRPRRLARRPRRGGGRQARAAAVPPRTRIGPGGLAAGWAGYAAAARLAGPGLRRRRPGTRSVPREISAGKRGDMVSRDIRLSLTGRQPVVTAIVLLKAEIHRIPEVAQTIAQLPSVSEVYSITGDYDLMAIVRVRAHDELADVIPGGLNKVDGVTATQTHIAFRTYSRHDLEAAFSIGLAE